MTFVYVPKDEKSILDAKTTLYISLLVMVRLIFWLHVVWSYWEKASKNSWCVVYGRPNHWIH